MTLTTDKPSAQFAPGGYARVATPEELQLINRIPMSLPAEVSRLGNQPLRILYVRNHPVRPGAKSIRFEGIPTEFSSWYFVSVPPSEEDHRQDDEL